jgi:putative hydrolase of the HAD superfamily
MAARNHLVLKTVVKAVGFDLDETLIFYPGEGINWTQLCPEALKHATSACKLQATQEQIEIGRSILGQHTLFALTTAEEVDAGKIFGEIFKAWGVAPEEMKLQVAIDSYFSYFQRDTRAYPEVASVLRSLRNQGIKCGALIDIPYGMPRQYVAQDLERAGITQLMDNTVTSVEAGARKPHPSGFLALAKFLGVAPEQTVYVGSDRKNIEGANNAGMISVLVDRHQTNLDFGQQFTITKLDQLLDYLYVSNLLPVSVLNLSARLILK